MVALGKLFSAYRCVSEKKVIILHEIFDYKRIR